jgi:uncharacterized SAM-binding protein YcdF (DUF218 family)
MKIPLKRVAIGVLSTAFLLFCFLGAMMIAAGDYLVHPDEPRRVGAVILLSGGGDERIDEAARLMRERYAEQLILTDTDTRMKTGLLEWEYLRLELIDRGVSPAQIQPTYHTVGSTRDEAQAVKELMLRHHISSCLVVTDPYHTRRTRFIFRQEMQGSGIEVSVVSAQGHWYTAYGWFLSLRGWQTTFSEYIKLVLVYSDL